MIQGTRHITLIAGLLVAASSFAQAPAGAPAGTTGMCSDGTYTSGTNKPSACRGHKGISNWYAPAKSAAAPATAAPGGGPGMVWVNTKSKTYHCPNDEWYGKTKDGQYMSEAAAKTAGDHPEHGKACTA